MNPEDIAKAQFTAAKNMENSLKAIEAEVVREKKNQLFGRNEYVKDDGKGGEGLIPMARIQKTNARLADTASKEILMGIENTLTKGIDILMTGITRTTMTLLRSGFGLSEKDKPEKITEKIEALLKMGYQSINSKQDEIKAEEERMKKYYKEGTGKDQRISANIKITQVGLGENFRIDQNGKSFLDVYNV